MKAEAEPAPARSADTQDTVQEMKRLVAQLQVQPAPSQSDECKALHGLEAASRALHAALDERPGYRTQPRGLTALYLALDDLVDGRCGARPMKRSYFDDFYRAVYRAVDELDASSRSGSR